MKHSSINGWLLGVFLLCSGCTIDENSLHRFLTVPEDFEVVDFDSFTDRSSLEGSDYLSFAAKAVDFERIAEENSMTQIDNYPDSIDIEWRAIVQYVLETDRGTRWPSNLDFRRHPVYANIDELVAESDEPDYLRIGFSTEGRAFFIITSVD